MMRRIGFDRATLEGKVIEDSDKFLVMPAVIAREIVQDYPEGRAYKPADELEKAAWTGDGRWITSFRHPDTKLLVRRTDIKGRMENVRFVRDLMDPKTQRPMRRGVRADLRFFKDKIDEPTLDDMKTGAMVDVSIGFLFDEDKTPGEWEGQKYDFVQIKRYSSITC